MHQPFDYYSTAPEAVRPLMQLGRVVHDSGLEPKLLALVELRASQINGCAACLTIHSLEADYLGEDPKRLATIAAWREAGWFDERERAALEWTEALTLVATQRPSNELLERVRRQFDDRELVYLTLAITSINSWNRFNVAFRTPAESGETFFKQMHPAAAAANA